MYKLLTYDELRELARPSTYNRFNLVLIQFRSFPESRTLIDYYRVRLGYFDDAVFDGYGKPFSLSRVGRGKGFSEKDGFKENTYMKEWRAYLVDTGDFVKNNLFEWEDEDNDEHL